MVVVGITAIVVMVHLLGFSQRFQIADDTTACTRWLREYSGDQITSVARCQNGEAALIETDNGPGLVWAFGADTVAHRLAGADVVRAKDGLILRLHDFAAPKVRLRLDEIEAAAWQDKLERLTK